MEPKKYIQKFTGFSKKSSSSIFGRLPLDYEPRRQNRFLLRMGVGGGHIFESFVNTSRPTMSVLDSGDMLGAYIPMGFGWEPIRLDFGYWTNEHLIDVVQEWMSLTNTPAPPPYGYEGLLNHSHTYKRDLEIEMLDPTGIVVEKYVLKGCYPISMELDSPYDETPQLSMTINTDSCELIY